MSADDCHDVAPAEAAPRPLPEHVEAGERREREPGHEHDCMFGRRWVHPNKMLWLTSKESHGMLRIAALALSLVQLFADLMCFFLSAWRGSVFSWIANPMFVVSAIAGTYGSVRIVTWLLFGHVGISGAMVVMLLITCLYEGFSKGEWTRMYIHSPMVIDLISIIPSLIMAIKLVKYNKKHPRSPPQHPPAAVVPLEAINNTNSNSNSNNNNQTHSDSPQPTITTTNTQEKKPETTTTTTTVTTVPTPIPPNPIVTTTNANANAANDETMTKCIVCLERERNIVFYKCGHQVMCEECSFRLLEQTHEDKAKCPVCRAEIDDFVKVFK